MLSFSDFCEEVWDEPNPKKTHKKLSPSQKSRAKARAKAAGRPYPNLVDNMAVAKEEVELDEARRKSAASLGFISTNAGHGITASSEPYGDKHLPVVTTSSGKRVDVGHKPYPTPELARQGAEEFIKNTYTKQGVDPVRGFRALSNHHQTHGMQKANEEVEQVDEASREKLKKYLVDLEADPNYPDYPTPKEFRKRTLGGGRAIAKLGGRGRNRIKVSATKEEVEQIDELKRKTLERYRDVAKKDYENTSSDEDRRKARNRLKGIARSMDKTEGPEHSKEAGVKPARVRATEEVLSERGADSKGYFRPTEKGAGLTQKGAKHFGIQTAVTEPNPKGKRASRRKSFCARMSGMPGPMKDEKGRPTRKAASLRRWRC